MPQTIKNCYDQLIKEIERTKNIKVGRLTLTDDNGIVSMRIIPKIQEIDLQFTNSGEYDPVVPTPPTPPTPSEPEPNEPDDEDDIIVIPTDGGDGLIIEWGPKGEVINDDVIFFSTTEFEIYRDNQLVATATSPYTDSPLDPGTYTYHVVNKTTGKASKSVTITL